MSNVLLKDHYLVKDGYNMTFLFEFVQQDNGDVLIYILEQPDYRPDQDQSSHGTHRYGVGTSRPYICFEPNPKNLQDAKNVAAEWAKRTAFYIRHNTWPNVGSSITRKRN